MTPVKKAIYYCNRALANLKMENYSFALFDACEAIKQDDSNVKGYYRRGQAYVALRQLKNAVSDFKTICKRQPSNKDAREKYDITQKEHRLQLLSASIVHEEKRITVDVLSMDVSKDYTGPSFKDTDEITPEWVESMMEW